MHFNIKVDLVPPVYSGGAVALTEFSSFFLNHPPPLKIGISSGIYFSKIIFLCFTLPQSSYTYPTIKIFKFMYKYPINAYKKALAN